MIKRAERRSRRAAKERELLISRCKGRGVPADAAVPAFRGLYPFYEGYSNWGLFFTRWCVLTLQGSDVHAYSAHSGPVPVKHLQTAPIASLIIGRQSGNYTRVAVGRRTYWIKREDRATVADWATQL